MTYIAYTPNTDGSVTILAGSDNPAVFPAILPAGTEFEVHEGEVFTAGGKTWLSQDDEGYIEAKAAEEQEKALAQLDQQYNADKAILSEQYTMAMLTDDTELADELKAELVALNEDYDKAYEEIVGGE